MHASEALVRTASASKYLRQICRHWSHKFAVEFTPQAGRIPFADDRVCKIAAGPDGLRLRVEASDEEALARAERVVVEHLRRFAFREDLGEVAWRRGHIEE